jgi:hypothetical protein
MDFDKESFVDHTQDVDYHLYDQDHLENLSENELITPQDDNIEEVEPLEIVKKIKKKKIKEVKQKYYVDNTRFEELIKKYYETDIFSDELAMMLYNIANRASFSTNFINYSFKDEMIGEGLLKEIQTLKAKKFDVTKGKAFNYFSTIVFNAFVGKIKEEQKEHESLRDHQSREYDILTNGMKITTNTHDEHYDTHI